MAGYLGFPELHMDAVENQEVVMTLLGNSSKYLKIFLCHNWGRAYSPGSWKESNESLTTSAEETRVYQGRR